MADNRRTVPAAQSAAAGTAENAESTLERKNASTEPGKVEDVRFLAEQFDMPVRSAAELVLSSNSPRVDDIVTEAARLDDEADVLEGAPTPEEPASDFVEDQDDVRLKPVLHSRNERAGGG